MILNLVLICCIFTSTNICFIFLLLFHDDVHVDTTQSLQLNDTVFRAVFIHVACIIIETGEEAAKFLLSS